MRVHHVAISVKSLEESKGFYCEAFGFKPVKEFERKDLRAKAVFLSLQDFHLEIWEFENAKTNKDDLSDMSVLGIKHIAFAVENLDETIKKLKEEDVSCTEPKLGASGHRYSFTKDPNGIALELYEAKAYK